METKTKSYESSVDIKLNGRLINLSYFPFYDSLTKNDYSIVTGEGKGSKRIERDSKEYWEIVEQKAQVHLIGNALKINKNLEKIVGLKKDLSYVENKRNNHFNLKITLTGFAFFKKD